MFNESVEFGYLSLETVIWSACRKNIYVHENQNLLRMLSQDTSIEAEKQLSYCGSTIYIGGGVEVYIFGKVSSLSFGRNNCFHVVLTNLIWKVWNPSKEKND